MDNWFRFWRIFPRLALGITATASLLCILIPAPTLNAALVAMITWDWKSLLGVVPGVGILLALLSLSSIGILILDTAISVLSFVFHLVPRVPMFHWCIKSHGLAPLFLTVSQIAHRYLLKHKEQLLGYYFLKSWAQPEVLGQVKELQQHMDKIAEEIKRLDDLHLLETLDYYSAVTQDQAKLDHMREEIMDFYRIAMCSAFTILASFNYFLPRTTVLTLTLAALGVMLIALFVAVQRKLHLARYVSVSFLDIFTLGEGATVIDREAS
jgi:hypothetical protein